MKEMTQLLTVSILLWLSACDKNKTPKEQTPTQPFVTMHIDGMNWEADTILINNISEKKFSFYACIFNPNFRGAEFPRYEEDFTMYLIEKKIGKSYLKGAPWTSILDSVRSHTDRVPSYCHFSTTQEDGEFICERIQVDNNDSLNNWIEITKQEDNYKKIWGKFQMTMHRASLDHGCPIPRHPEQFNIRNGEFYIELPE